MTSTLKTALTVVNPITMTLPETVLYLLEHCLQFRVELTLDEAQTVLRQFKRYNEILDTLPRLIDDLRRDIGPIAFPGQNVNNGRFDNIKVSIGNEGSLVVYVCIITAYRKDNPARQVGVLKTIGETYNADEIDVSEGTGSVKARFWWD